MKKNRKWLLSLIPVASAVAAVVIMSLQPKQTVPLYSDVIGYFEAGQVREYTLNIHTGVLSARLRDGGTLTYTVPDVELFISRVEPVVAAYNTAHPESGIKFDYVQSGRNAAWQNALPYFLLVIAGSSWLIVRYGPGESDKRAAV